MTKILCRLGDSGCYCDLNNDRNCALVPRSCSEPPQCQSCREGQRDCLCVEVGDGNERLDEPFCCDNDPRCQGRRCCRDTRCRCSVNTHMELNSYSKLITNDVFSGLEMRAATAIPGEPGIVQPCRGHANPMIPVLNQSLVDASSVGRERGTACA